MVHSPSPEERSEPLAVSIPDAARLLAISERQAWYLAKTGVLPTARIGGRRVVPVEDLRRMLEAHRVEAGEPAS